MFKIISKVEDVVASSVSGFESIIRKFVILFFITIETYLNKDLTYISLINCTIAYYYCSSSFFCFEIS